MEVSCARCGQYQITRSAAVNLKFRKAEERPLLSAVTRNASEFGTPLKIKENDFDRLISSAPQYTPFEKMDRVLEYVGRKAPTFARTVSLAPQLNYPVAFARDETEFRELFSALIEKGLLKRHDLGTTMDSSLTLDGWERLDQVRKRTRRSDQAFVAMWFDPSMDNAGDEGFRPALETDLGYKPIRVDREQHNGKIDDYIVAMIRKSGLLVADFTGHRAGVYFETGFAFGLGIDVIWTCRADNIGAAHFDTRQYNHVVWNDPADLRKKLRERIEATIVSRPTPASGPERNA